MDKPERDPDENAASKQPPKVGASSDAALKCGLRCVPYGPGVSLWAPLSITDKGVSGGPLQWLEVWAAFRETWGLILPRLSPRVVISTCAKCGGKTLRQNGHVAGPVCTGGKASTGDKAGAGHNGSDPSLAGLLGIR